PDEEGTEEVEHPGEVLDGGGTQRDEDTAEHDGDDDPREEDLLLVVPWYPERRDDDDEDEEVVDGQALLGDVAGEVLQPVDGSPQVRSRVSTTARRRGPKPAAR